MTLRHFEILKAVAETGNFTKAAERLYITQSAVSHSIRELEEETGTALFDRAPRGVRITKNGRLLLEKAAPLLAAFEELEKQAKTLEAQAPLRIASSITIASFRLPAVLREFERRWPDAAVEVRVMSAAAAIRELLAKEADLALVEGTKPAGPFECREFASYRMAAVCSPDYRFKSGRADGSFRLSAEAFSGERLLLREPGSALRDTLDSALYLAGYAARPAWISVNSGALAAAAREGLGIAVLPELLIGKELEEGSLRRVEVEGLTLRNPMVAAWHRGRRLSGPVRTVLELLEEPEKEADRVPGNGSGAGQDVLENRRGTI